MNGAWRPLPHVLAGLATLAVSCGPDTIALLPGPPPPGPPHCPPPPPGPPDPPPACSESMTTCPMMLHCDVDASLCVQCSVTTDCPMDQVCRPTDGKCVACITASDCMPGQSCDDANRCVPGGCVLHDGGAD
jgi:hypothetical protein